MTRLNQLPQIAQECLGGLKASEEMLATIKKSRPAKRTAVPAYQRALAFAFSLVFLFGIGAFSMGLLGKSQQPPEIRTQKAGQLPPGGMEAAYDMPRGSIKLAEQGVVPTYVGVWASSNGGNFPMVRADGRYYRLLKNPTAINSALLGNSFGGVSVFTDEPALDSSNALLSNVVPEGGEVYTIRGMDGAAVAAEIDGSLRVFQRVSFAGTALMGGEGLGSTLNGRVTGLQLSGIGSITDQSTVDRLMGILTSQATWQGSASRSTDQALLIQYDNGIVLQMSVKGAQLSACGTWNCDGFIQAFQEALQ